MYVYVCIYVYIYIYIYIYKASKDDHKMRCILEALEVQKYQSKK